ncbi:hypothetical protein BCR36DRAFT_356032 [Piromyces finnis]|uniref:Uncharacterized protein n=1 Tax=Piromyces finnis TaxID=1754191 RepID=A0A1Y1V505_9FUNG|nr:hypothetical protein BCR36DRAFT_356032 [Piromyces finnis]|eukprot:ORX47365.1 hypothetical protein BCR36DRAFT_356032 [Piromyces finnis]
MIKNSYNINENECNYEYEYTDININNNNDGCNNNSNSTNDNKSVNSANICTYNNDNKIHNDIYSKDSIKYNNIINEQTTFVKTTNKNFENETKNNIHEIIVNKEECSQSNKSEYKWKNVPPLKDFINKKTTGTEFKPTFIKKMHTQNITNKIPKEKKGNSLIKDKNNSSKIKTKQLTSAGHHINNEKKAVINDKKPKNEIKNQEIQNVVDMNSFISIPFIETIEESDFYLHPIKAENLEKDEKDFNYESTNTNIYNNKKEDVITYSLKEEDEEMKNIQSMIESLKKRISQRSKTLDPLKYQVRNSVKKGAIKPKKKVKPKVSTLKSLRSPPSYTKPTEASRLKSKTRI